MARTAAHQQRDQRLVGNELLGMSDARACRTLTTTAAPTHPKSSEHTSCSEYVRSECPARAVVGRPVWARAWAREARTVLDNAHHVEEEAPAQLHVARALRDAQRGPCPHTAAHTWLLVALIRFCERTQAAEYFCAPTELCAGQPGCQRATWHLHPLQLGGYGLVAPLQATAGERYSAVPPLTRKSYPGTPSATARSSTSGSVSATVS
jgi:hypothetical protein